MGLLKLSYAGLAAAILFRSFCNAAPAGLITPFKRDDTKFPFGSKKVRGVNLGGWLVLEPWITPSIFEESDSSVVDEWTMGESLGAEEMEKRLKQHWSTWIVEEDFKDIAELGLNFVRISLGYWSVLPIDGEPYVQGAYEYVPKALDWAKKHDLKVMIDLHGAPGSQNGYDSSGRKGSIRWTQGDTVEHTYKTLNKIRDDHASHPALATIELLNEPYTPFLGRQPVEDFYSKGYSNFKGADVVVSIQTAYEGIGGWNSFSEGKDNLIVDAHPYQIFKTGQIERTPEEHNAKACQVGETMKKNKAWTIAGEFTAALTDCAKWLNGRNFGARYDGNFEGSTYIGSCDGKSVGTVNGLSEDDKSDIKAYVKAQMTAYEKAEGWIFWTWVTESAPEWHYKNLTSAGLIPKPGSLDGSAC